MPTISSLIQEYGVKNLRFFIPMRPLEFVGVIPGIAFKSNSTDEEIVECEIDESRYKISENYKITLKAIEDPTTTTKLFGREHYYVMDLNSLLRRDPDMFRVYALTIDGYVRLTVD